MPRQRLRRTGPSALLALLALPALGLGTGAAYAAPASAPTPWWHLSAGSAPTVLRPGDHDDVVLASASNLGDADAEGSAAPIAISDQLPAGLIAKSVQLVSSVEHQEGDCEALPALRCTFSKVVQPYVLLQLRIVVEVPAGLAPGQLQNRMEVQGGEAADASLASALTVADEPTRFGAEHVELDPEGQSGAAETLAGRHPFQLTTTLDFNQTLEPESTEPAAPALLKNLHFTLPPGLIGDPQATPKCSNLDFSTLYVKDTNLCPTDTVVGAASVTLHEPANAGYVTVPVPLFNLTPAPGEPARFGFEAFNVPVVLDTAVQTGGDYSVQVNVANATSAAQVLGSQVTFWGEPGDPRHDGSRGWDCIAGGGDAPEGQSCEAPDPRPTVPFLTLPTSCEGPLTATLSGDSWSGEQLQGQASIHALEGCGDLPFAPSIDVGPDVHSASTPTGLEVDSKVPQDGLLGAGARASADVRDSTVTLPVGVELSPSAANGLQACSEQEIGFKGFNGERQIDEFTPSAPSCPEASKLGLVHIKTPLLEHELQGAIYLATPAPNGEVGNNPFNSLAALYLIAEEPVSRVLVKLAGEVSLNEETLQATTTFANTPQVPFEELRLDLFGGPRASLSTPPHCGAYQLGASITPWSAPTASEVQSAPEELSITEGAEASPCQDPEPFAPGFSAQALSTQAGAFTPFTLTIARRDQDQALSGVSVKLPPGAAALLSEVTPCPEPQASEGSCGPESLIGHARVSAGLGSEPVSPPEGEVFITGPYRGAPFGLSIVAPAVAGPFDLGNVVVRSKIEVDPHTAQASIQSEPLPTELKGIPLQLKDITVSVDRPNFEYNPTSCAPMKVEGTLQGAEGQSHTVSSPFQVGGCQNLPFKPIVTAQTQGKTSKANGASLSLKFASAKGQANVAKTVLTIPAILPARLSTIQKACLAKTFEANPASCPEGSDIGQAVVHTPVLKSPLTGPIYLVSHGNAAWPDAELVLQGEGITVILDGQTAIKKGITTSSFQAVPDAPFSSLEASLPEGPHSALTTNLPVKAKYSLCGQKLQIPMVLTGQNGAPIEQKTKVSVQGCGAVKATKAKKLTRAQKLKKALASCRKRFKRSKGRRRGCEAKARKAFGGKRRTHKTERAKE